MSCAHGTPVDEFCFRCSLDDGKRDHGVAPVWCKHGLPSDAQCDDCDLAHDREMMRLHGGAPGTVTISEGGKPLATFEMKQPAFATTDPEAQPSAVESIKSDLAGRVVLIIQRGAPIGYGPKGPRNE